MTYDRFAVPEGLLILVFLVALGVLLFGSWRGRPDLGRRGFLGVLLASLTTTLLVQFVGTELIDGRLGQLALGGVRITVNRVMLGTTVLLYVLGTVPLWVAGNWLVVIKNLTEPT